MSGSRASVGQERAREQDFYRTGISIAFLIQSLDLFAPLIPYARKELCSNSVTISIALIIHSLDLAWFSRRILGCSIVCTGLRHTACAYYLGKVVLEMKIGVGVLIILAVFSNNSLAQEYTRWGLPEGAKFRLGKGNVTRIAYSPDGAQIAVATEIGVWLYDAETYKETALLTTEDGWAESVAFSLDGEMLAFGTRAWDAAVHLWNAKTGEHLFTLTDDFGTVASVAFSPGWKDARQCE